MRFNVTPLLRAKELRALARHKDDRLRQKMQTHSSLIWLSRKRREAVRVLHDGERAKLALYWIGKAEPII